jgi:hypothetical protein
MVGSFSEPATGSPAAGSGGTNSAEAAVPRLIKFSGAVRDTRGEPLGAVAVRLTFAVYEEPTGGAALWAETQVVELDERGHYSVLLGATRADGLPVQLFPAGKARWLGVQIEGRDEDPRVLLVSVPYALKAEDAAMLGGRRASDFVLAEQLKEEVRTQVEAQKPATSSVEMLIPSQPIRPAFTDDVPSSVTCTASGDCMTLTQSGTGRALRGTATSTTEAVLVQQNGTGYGARVLAAGNIAVLGQVTGSAGTSYGVKGQTTSTTGAGVFGYNLGATGLAYGILGQTASADGTALFGRATSTTGATIGLRGHSDSTTGTGILGQATATSGTTTGLVARVFSVDGTALIVDNTQGGKLLSGKVGSTEKFSVNGSGNVTTSGSVTATSFAGSGSALTALNATSLASGTVPSARISGTYSSAVTLSNPSNVLYGDGSHLSGVSGGGGVPTDLNCSTPCVSPSEVTFNYADSASKGGAAADALELNGVAAASYARLDLSNTFAINQTFGSSVLIRGDTSSKQPIVVAVGAGNPIADTWDDRSSQRWKANIRTLKGAVETVQRLRGVSYDRKVDGKHEIGVIAEEVGAVLPEVVSYEENGVDAQGVAYGRLTAVLIEAVKEQQVQIRALQAEIEQLRTARHSSTETAGR